MDKEIVTTKIERASLRLLKQIAAHTNERMTDVLRRLIAAEWAHLQQEMRHEGEARLQDGTGPQ